VPTPEEAWSELLSELMAASQELYDAFVVLSSARQDNEASPTAAMAQTQRYDEALRRWDAARARVKVFRAEFRSCRAGAPLAGEGTAPDDDGSVARDSGSC